MLFFLGAGASVPFGVPTMSDFVKLLDKEVGDSPFWQKKPKERFRVSPFGVPVQ